MHMAAVPIWAITRQVHSIERPSESTVLTHATVSAAGDVKLHHGGGLTKLQHHVRLTLNDSVSTELILQY